MKEAGSRDIGPARQAQQESATGLSALEHRSMIRTQMTHRTTDAGERRESPAKRLLLIGCGILQVEVRHLIAANAWPVDTVFLPSALHIDFGKLEHVLSGALTRYADRDIVVFYGCCHPRMEQLLDPSHALRTAAQNCIEMLLGPELFTHELANGAFFLLEEWARDWQQIVTRSFGTSRVEVIRDMFKGDRTYLLALRTPCSTAFEAEARDAAQLVDLPLRWMDVTLEHLESVLRATFEQKARELGGGTSAFQRK